MCFLINFDFNCKVAIPVDRYEPKRKLPDNFNREAPNSVKSISSLKDETWEWGHIDTTSLLRAYITHLSINSYEGTWTNSSWSETSHNAVHNTLQKCRGIWVAWTMLFLVIYYTTLQLLMQLMFEFRPSAFIYCRHWPSTRHKIGLTDFQVITGLNVSTVKFYVSRRVTFPIL